MNPICIWLLGLGLTLSAVEAEAAAHKTFRLPKTPTAIQPASGDALRGVQEVIKRRREYPHYLFTAGASMPPLKALDTIMAMARTQADQDPDTLRFALIRVEFEKNTVPGQFTGSARFDLTVGTSIPVDPPPHNRTYFEAHGEALMRYYHTQSYGGLLIESTVYPPGENAAYQLGDPADYGPWDVGQDTTIIGRAERFVTEAVLLADASGDIDFSRVDGVVVLHAGADFQGDVNRDTPFDIPSFTLTFGIPLETSSGVVTQVSVIPETTSQDDLWGALNGVMAHEVGHLLGLPDLYNIFNGAPQVGWFSLMDSGENLVIIVGDADGNILYEARGTTPTSLDPWSKLQAFPRAAERLIVGSSQAEFENGFWETNLSAGITNPSIPMVIASPNEYYLIENRVLDYDGNGTSYTDQDSVTGVFLGPGDDPSLPGQGGKIEYDWPIPGNGGVAIWHIDDALINLGLSVRGGVNLAIGYRGVALEEADGIWDIGYNTGFPFGHPNDLFFVGNNTLFDPFSTPSSETNSGAYSGITIQVNDVPGRFMQVRVQSPLSRPDWPLSVSAGFELQHMAITLATGEPLPLVAFRNDDAETYGLFVPTTTFEAGHSLPLPNPVITKHDFEFAAGNRGMLTATIDSKGQLVAWDAEGEELFTAGRFLTGAPQVTGISDDESSRELLLVESEAGVESWTGDGENTMIWEFGELPRTSNVASFADNSFAVAFIGELCQFDLRKTTPLRCISLPERIDRILIGENGESQVKIFAFSRTRIFILSEDGWSLEDSWELPAQVGPEAILIDLDQDGALEVALADTSGTLWVYNQDGSNALGWPVLSSERWTSLRSSDVDNDGRMDLMAVSESGLLYAFQGEGEVASSFPRPFANGVTTPVWLERHEGRIMAFGVTTGFLWSWNLPGTAAPEGSWLAPQGGPRRRSYLKTPLSEVQGPDLGPSAFVVYPNPTMGSNVEMRFNLEPGEKFEITIIDVSGRTVKADLDYRESPKLGENAVQWVVQDLAPGLYYCLLQRSGVDGTKIDKVKIAVLQ